LRVSDSFLLKNNSREILFRKTGLISEGRRFARVGFLLAGRITC